LHFPPDLRILACDMTARLPASGTPIAFVKGICLGYAKYGVDPTSALEKAQIPPELLLQAEARVTPAQFEALSFVAMQELDDEALGWFSRRLPWGAYGLLCRASITSATLDLALRRWIRHHRILIDDIVLTLDVKDGVAKIAVHETRDLGVPREFCLVSLLRYMLGYACWAVDFRIPLLGADFPFTAPPHVDIYPKLFAENLRFGAECASVSFDARFLTRALQRDEAALQKMLKRALPLTVLPYRRDQRLSTRVKSLMSMPKAELPAAHDLAEDFAISTRTLHRHLRKEGASLRDLQKKARIDRAKEGLARSNDAIKRVAHAAGFKSDKAFARAFKTATGETPSAFRTRMRQG